MDAAERLAYLAFSDPAMRPMETNKRGVGGGTYQGENTQQQHHNTIQYDKMQYTVSPFYVKSIIKSSDPTCSLIHPPLPLIH